MVLYVQVDLFGVVVLAFEALETEDEDLGGFVDLHLFAGENEVLAFGTVPSIILS